MLFTSVKAVSAEQTVTRAPSSTGRVHEMSSAYLVIKLSLKTGFTSLTIILKNTSPNTVPCGTPLFIGKNGVFKLAMQTLYLQSLKKVITQLIT